MGHDKSVFLLGGSQCAFNCEEIKKARWLKITVNEGAPILKF
jgi:hypothetical protein